MEKTNEHYSLIEDEDLNRTEGYNSMILACPECGALFRMKACGNRTLFPWFGYHPTNGNCVVITREFAVLNQIAVNKCDCEPYPKRIRTKDELDAAIDKLDKP